MNPVITINELNQYLDKITKIKREGNNIEFTVNNQTYALEPNTNLLYIVQQPLQPVIIKTVTTKKEKIKQNNPI